MAQDSSPPPPHRRRYLVIAAVLVVVAAAAVVAASRTSPSTVSAGSVNVGNLPIGPQAPRVDAKGWLNSRPLTSKDLAGKVVVYDFWTYSCVNCVRTLPFVRSWYQRYRADGLVVIGIHSPEFDFEKDHGNVTRAVRQLGVTWPVAFDDDMHVWNAFNNQYWPAKYITDRQGRVRFFHPGEGNYSQTEDVIRSLLGLPASAPRAATPGAAPGVAPDQQSGQPGTGPGVAPEQQSGPQLTPETYLGTERGTAGANAGTVTYPDPGTPALGTARLAGSWAASSQLVQAVHPGAAVVLHYQGREVNLVMSPPEAGPVDVTVSLDGAPLPPSYRTTQTMVDSQGHTFVRVTAADMYRLVLGPAVGQHVLRLVALGPGLEAFAFTFGT